MQKGHVKGKWLNAFCADYYRIRSTCVILAKQLHSHYGKYEDNDAQYEC